MRRREQGVVLILVMAVVTLLGICAIELGSRANRDATRRGIVRRETALRRLVDSGTEVARNLLGTGTWRREVRFTLGEDEEARVELQDESAKLNVARAIGHAQERVRILRQLRKLMRHLEEHEPALEPSWTRIGADLEKRLKSDVPLLTLADLCPGREPTAAQHDVLARYLTCYGDGRINVNTASRTVLSSLDGLDEAAVGRLIALREKRLKEGRLLSDAKEVVALVHADMELLAGQITFESACAAAHIEASAGKRRRVAWVYLSPRGQRMGALELDP